MSVTEDVGTYDWKQEIEASVVQVVNEPDSVRIFYDELTVRHHNFYS